MQVPGCFAEATCWQRCDLHAFPVQSTLKRLPDRYGLFLAKLPSRFRIQKLAAILDRIQLPV